jgi:hypothetical protein
MKLKKLIPLAVVAAGMAFGAASASAQASPYPLVPLSISGTLYYSTNNGEPVMKAPLIKSSFNNATLIKLLNASPYATNILHIMTGSNQIPAKSSILWDPYEGNLIITNKDGYSFTLYGYYVLAGDTNTYNYDLGYLVPDDEQLIGTYSLSAKTSSGTETDKTGMAFYFSDNNDANYNSMSIYGMATMDWTYGAAKAGYQKATLSVTMSGNGEDYCYVDDNDAIPSSFSATGTGSLSEATDWVPFYYYDNY